MMNVNHCLAKGAFAALLVSMGAQRSNGALLGYDGFEAGDSNAEGEYIANPGTLTDGRHRLTSGQNPTRAGFSGSWEHASGMFELGAAPAPSLAYGDGSNDLATSGNRIFRGFTGQSSRAIDNNTLGLGQAGVRYISFLMRLETVNTEARIDFGEAAFQDWGQLGIRVENGVFNARFAGQTAVSMGATDANTHLFVWKVETGSTQKATLYMDPDLASESANSGVLVGTVALGTYAPTHLTLSKRSGTDGEEVMFDEIRIGETWNDVTTIPEPSALGLLSAVGVGLIGARRLMM